MKFLFKHAMASVLISSSMIIPMATPILAESTSTTPITEVKIETPEDFVNYCLSFKKTVDNKTVYEAFKVVDDTNYQTILNSETTYQELAKDETKKDAIDELVKKNTENVYPTYDSLLKAAKDKDASIKAQQEAEKKQQEEQAAQEKAAQEQAAQEAAQKEAAQKAEQQATQKTTQTTSSSSTNQRRIQRPIRLLLQQRIHHLQQIHNQVPMRLQIQQQNRKHRQQQGKMIRHSPQRHKMNMQPLLRIHNLF